MPAHPNVQPEKGFLFPGRTQQFKSYPNAVYNITLNVNVESNVFLLEDECLKAEILWYAEGYGQCYFFLPVLQVFFSYHNKISVNLY